MKEMDEKWNDAINSIRLKAYKVHEDVNQKYGDKPYSYHLHSVELKTKELIESFYQEIDGEEYTAIVFGALFHDSIEDARLSYNDVKKIALEFLSEKYATMASDIVYALTNEKGKTRAERANDKYYEGIRNTTYAPLVKLADRLANMEYSCKTQSSMHKKYMSEWDHFLLSIGWSSFNDLSKFKVNCMLANCLQKQSDYKDYMTIEEIVNEQIEKYITNHLEIEVEAEPGIGETNIKISLLCEGNPISEAKTISIPVNKITLYR